MQKRNILILELFGGNQWIRPVAIQKKLSTVESHDTLKFIVIKFPGNHLHKFSFQDEF
jgi:hypothetical protein